MPRLVCHASAGETYSRTWHDAQERVMKWETATPTRLSFEILEKVAGEIVSKVPGIVSVTYNIVPKPPPTIEVV